jgi:hypothetical protein
LNEKKRLKEAAKRVNGSNYGQEKLMEREIKKRVQLALENSGVASITFTDEDTLALKEFE